MAPPCKPSILSMSFTPVTQRTNSQPALSFGGFGAASSTPSAGFQFGSNQATPATPASTGFQFGASPAAAASQPSTAASSSGFQFGAQPNPAPTSSLGFSFGGQPSTTTPSTSSLGAGFNFGTSSNTAPSTAPSFNFGSSTPATAPSTNQFFSATVPAQTSTGMPYPKETKFADLPNEVKSAIETLEKTIREYESSSFQVSNRRYESVSMSESLNENIEKKLRVFEFAIQHNQNRMVAAKRNLGKYWKYGETVARHLSNIKVQQQQQQQQQQALQSQQPSQPNNPHDIIPSTDVKFLEGILQDFDARAKEMQLLAQNIRSLLEHLQHQPLFTLSNIKETIKSHSEALFALADSLSTFHEDVEELRNQYRRFCLLYRHDSRDPFSKSQSHPEAPQHPTAQQPSQHASFAAPSISNVLAQQQQQPNVGLFGTPKPATSFGGFSFPSSNSFMNK